MFLFNNLYELLTIVSNLFHRKKIDFELWKTVSNLYKCFEIKMNLFLVIRVKYRIRVENEISK